METTLKFVIKGVGKVAKTKNINIEWPLLNQSQIACMTGATRDGTMNMENRKPYRTKAQKAEAKAKAGKSQDGVFRSIVPRSYHGKNAKAKVRHETTEQA